MLAVGEHTDRSVVFADAVDPAGEVIFGAKGRFQKTFDDLAVGEGLLLRVLARHDAGNIRRSRGGSCREREEARGCHERSQRAAKGTSKPHDGPRFAQWVLDRDRNGKIPYGRRIAQYRTVRNPQTDQFFTITVVPTETRLYRSVTSSLVMRKQPDETAWPIVSGSLEPWMRYSVEPR